MKAHCCAEQKKNYEYKVQLVIIKTNLKNGIYQANCECPAGTGWSAACKHVAALCYSLEYFSISGMYSFVFINILTVFKTESLFCKPGYTVP